MFGQKHINLRLSKQGTLFNLDVDKPGKVYATDFNIILDTQFSLSGEALITV